MQSLDNRLVRVGIEIGGKIKYLEGVAIYAQGTKYACGIMNETTVSITNLNRADRDMLLTELSPTNKNREVNKKVIIEAGRVSTGYRRIFVGDCITASISQPPDITISIQARTAAFFNGVMVSNSFSGQTLLSEIAGKIATDCDKSLRFEATDKMISNFSFAGGAQQQVDLLASTGAVNAFIDDQDLIVKDSDKALKNSHRLLSEDTGMIGIPELDFQGVTVKFLIDKYAMLGGEIEIKSKLYKAVNGVYTIYKLDYEIANRDTPFYYTAKATRAGLGF